MNFTREPIIETIISPKEGYKLLVRNSRATGSSEEYYVDAVEVVSFGRAFFFRSLERPKAFLVPVSDYEILEVKETRVALKNVSHERSIKIGGGREASLRHREPVQEKEPEPIALEEEQPAAAPEERVLETAIGQRMEKRRDRRRRRHRRSSEDTQEWGERRQQPAPAEKQEKPETEAQGGAEEEGKISSAMFSSLIPPPTTLISDTIHRYKEKESAEEEDKHRKKHHHHHSDDEESGTDSSPLNRVATPSITSEAIEISNFSTYFSPLQGGKDYFF